MILEVINILIYKNSLISNFELVDEKVNVASKKFKDIFLNNKANNNIDKIELEAFNLNYILRELINNGIEHGNNFEITKNIEFKISILNNLLTIEVQDFGDGFDLAEILKKVENDELRERNRGIISILKMGYKIEVNNNQVIVTRELGLMSNGFNLEDIPMDVLVENGIALCTLNKNLTANNIKEFVEVFKNLIEKNTDYNKVIIDLSRTENMDSMGITFLIGSYKSFSAKGKKISLNGVSEGMLQLLKLMKLDEIFEIAM